MAYTLAGLRARVRTQIENACGSPDPLPLATSTETLATLRDRVEAQLSDELNLRWTPSDIDECIEKALEHYNAHNPQLAIATLTLGADGREVDISSITGLIRVEKVWWPYDSASPSYPPNWVQFDVLPGSLLFIDEPTAPATGEKVRIWYTKLCTISGLNAAASTTVPADDITHLLTGALHFAALQRSMAAVDDLTVDSKTTQNLHDYAEEMGKAFRYGIRQDAPAWQRYAYAYNQNDIDEAIRWAVGRFNAACPQETIGTLTLASAGREIDTSSLTGLLRVTRVWWPYTASDPEYPPNWVPFEQWGTTLFLKTGSEPAASDVVRVWYTKLHMLSGLDGAASTTLPADTENLIVTGAVGWVAEERILEQPGRSVPRRLAEWSDLTLKRFNDGLDEYRRAQAAGQAGLHPLPAMDRWENTDDDLAW